MEYRIFEKRPQSFIGTFADGRLHMVRLVRGRNSIRPWIDATLSRAGNGCRVHVRLKMPTLAIVAFIPAFIVGALALIFAAYYTILMLPALAIFAAPFIAASLEAGKATRMLAALLESEAKASQAVNR